MLSKRPRKNTDVLALLNFDMDQRVHVARAMLVAGQGDTKHVIRRDRLTIALERNKRRLVFEERINFAERDRHAVAVGGRQPQHMRGARCLVLVDRVKSRLFKDRQSATPEYVADSGPWPVK